MSEETFDPRILDHAVIAIPLLKKIEDESAWLEKIGGPDFPTPSGDNAVILCAGGEGKLSADERRELQAMLDEALARSVFESESERERHRLGADLPGWRGVFAWLDARTIRRLARCPAPEGGTGTSAGLRIERILPERYQVIIDLNLEFLGGRKEARNWVDAAIATALRECGIDDPGQRVHVEKSRNTDQYVFATLEARVLTKLVHMDSREIDLDDPSAADLPGAVKAGVLRDVAETDVPEGQKSRGIGAIPRRKLRAIYRIWPDFEVRTRITRSICTVKANAAINSFAARGTDITWAVMDTGIQGDHPHFERWNNIVDPLSPMHRDFTPDEPAPLVDANGHGTHVAGIIAGEFRVKSPGDPKGGSDPLRAVARYQDEHGDAKQETGPVSAISGMAPECRLVSLKVLDENGIGNASNLIAAIAHIQEINGYGRRLLIHGVNISIGYDFEPKWFACGQSPLCVEVDRLVKSGVSVVVAAGNTGYGAVDNGSTNAGLTVTINDPGNAECALTVGATHRDAPHVYGVSYFSSKGPTGDGRRKPDLVAPGERIVSCASSLPGPAGAPRIASRLKAEIARDTECDYIETSGTSMAAPHVSGVIAAFLSVRREFIGQPEKVKEIFMATATDLRRDPYFQGAGLIDLMRAIQSV